MSDWAKVISDHLAEQCAPVPKGWKTLKEIAKELGLGVSHASKLTRELMAAGKAEKRKFKVKRTAGNYQVGHYRLIKKAVVSPISLIAEQAKELTGAVKGVPRLHVHEALYSEDQLWIIELEGRAVHCR